MSQRNFRYNGGGGQQHWIEQGAMTGVNAPGAPQTSAPPIGEGTAKRVVDALGEFGRVAGPILGREHIRIETGKVDDAILSAKREFEVWKNDYNAKNQGRLAINAQADYMAAWDEISNRKLEEWQGPEHEIFGDTLKQRLYQEGADAAHAGGQWEYRQREIWQTSQLQAQTDEVLRYVGANPGDTAGIARKMENWTGSYEAKNLGQDNSAAIAGMSEKVAMARLDGFMAQGQLDEARKLLNQIKTGGGRGAVSSQFEGGKDAHLAIGYDRNGGTSYGKYQLSSKQGSLQEWCNRIDKRDDLGKEIAAKLRAAGDPNTGGVKGTFPEVYRQLAAQYPEYFDTTQREYLTESHFKPALAAIKSQSLRQMIEGDEGLLEMVFSTAVQHGGGGAARLLNSVWREGMSRDGLIESLYDKRATQFPSSTKQVQDAVRARFAKEKEVIRNYKGGGILPPDKIARYEHDIDLRMKEREGTQQFEFAQEHASVVAAAKTGVFTDTGKTEQDYVHAFGEIQGKKAWAEYQEARLTAEDINTIKTMTPEQMQEWLIANKPEMPKEGEKVPHDFAAKVVTYDRRMKLVAESKKQLQDNPTQYLFDRSETARKAWEKFSTTKNIDEAGVADYVSAIAGAQIALGIPEESREIFPKEWKQQIISGVINSADPQAAMGAIAKGAGKQYDILRYELSRHMSPAENLRCFIISPEGNAVLNSLYRDPKTGLIPTGVKKNEIYEKRKKDIIETRNIKDNRMTLLTGMLEDNLRDAMQSYPGVNDASATASIMGSAIDIAIALISGGAQDAEAAKKAAEMVYNHRYNFVHPVGDKPVRVPKQYDPDLIERGINSFRKKIDISKVDFAELRGMSKDDCERQYKNWIETGSVAVTSPDESGIELTLAGRTVYGKDGKPIIATWDELLNLGAANKDEAKMIELSGTWGLY